MTNILKITAEKLKKLKNSILLILGITSILYFFAITLAMRYLNLFNFIWVFIGIAFILLHQFKETIIAIYKKTPKIGKVFFWSSVIIFLLSFAVVESLIAANAKTSAAENADYIIILGSRTHKNIPSFAMAHRVIASLKYIKENPNAQVVLTGGKTSSAEISEAEIMLGLLQKKGVEPNRIIIENRSKNTYQNLKYSSSLIDIDKKVLIVSSEFHLFRAKLIAAKIGYKDVGTAASKTPRLLLPHYLLREYLAVIKDY